MDRQKEIQSIKEEYQNLFEAVQNLSKHIENMESVISTPEPKEPETWEELWSSIDHSGDGVLQLELIESDQKIVSDFAKRLLVADYCGRREFDERKANFAITKRGLEYKIYPVSVYTPGDNYFPTKEAAEKYLRICQNSNLL